MNRNNTRLFPLFITMIVIIVVIVAIVSIARAIFFSGDRTTTTETAVDQGREELLKTTEDHSVSLTVRGPIVAQEEFKSYRVIVSPSSRDLSVYRGYLEDKEKTKQLTNNRTAYEQFVYALDKANMMKGTVPTDDAKNDLRGICAGGYVYEYSVLVNNEAVKRLWTSTCDGSKGSLEASVEQLNGLFYAQIPGAEDLIPSERPGLRLQL